jgi:uncharacterized lipoprotein NlpE involved in copper resistance
MMRKLAVTVFAMSLTLVGCGSSSTSKKDAGPDAQTTTDVGAKLDVVVATPDTLPPTTDVVVLTDGKTVDGATDVSITPDTAPKTDVSGDVTPITTDARDGSVTDVQAGDTVVVVRLDATADTKITTTDAPADTTPVSADAGLEVGGDAETD